jgi:cytochrome c2
MRRLVLFLALGALAACNAGKPEDSAQIAKRLIADHCAACHVVPGVALATGRVGPSLAHIRQQQMIAGYFANTPGVLIRWIERPQEMLPGNAMPDMHLSHLQSMTIADYLYTMD